MSGPGYHGWTHLPKAQGGTDPIPGLESLAGTPIFAWARQSLVAGSNQNVGVGTNVQIAFNTSETDDASIFDLSSASEITVLQDGLYSFTGQVDYTTYGSYARHVWIVLTRTNQIIAQAMSTDLSDDWVIANGNFRLQAGDTIQLWVHQDGSGPATQVTYGGYDGSVAGGTDEGNFLEARLIGAAGGGVWAAGIQAFPITLVSATPKIVNFSSSWIDGTSTGGVATSSGPFHVFDSDSDGNLDAIGFLETGVYLISAKGEWAGAYNKVLEVQGFATDLGLGDSRIADQAQSVSATYGPSLTTVVILSSVVGDGTSDYVRLVATQSSGSNQSFDDAMLKVVRLGGY